MLQNRPVQYNHINKNTKLKEKSNSHMKIILKIQCSRWHLKQSVSDKSGRCVFLLYRMTLNILKIVTYNSLNIIYKSTEIIS